MFFINNNKIDDVEKCFACGVAIKPEKVYCGCGIPYAQFSFMGQSQTLSKKQLLQAVNDSSVCQCKNTSTCFVCRAREYYNLNKK